MTQPERLLFAAFLTWLCLRACTAEGQDADRLVLDVVQLAHHESVDPLADAPGIHAVLINGAARRGMSTHAFARSYAPRFFRGESARPWFSRLTLDCARPAGLRGRWRRDVCLATVELVRGLHAPACEAESWGSRADYRSGRWAAAHARDVFVDCGSGARNLFARRRRGGE